MLELRKGKVEKTSQHRGYIQEPQPSMLTTTPGVVASLCRAPALQDDNTDSDSHIGHRSTLRGRPTVHQSTARIQKGLPHRAAFETKPLEGRLLLSSKSQAEQVWSLPAAHVTRLLSTWPSLLLSMGP